MTAHAHTGQSQGNNQTDGKKLLIVDDSRAIQAIIRRALECEELGELQIQTARDGAEALDKVAAFRPDLVLSDWHMPGVSGIEMLQTLRQTGFHDVAVGFVTTDRASDCQTQARSNGALFLLHKPFDDQALRSAVALGLGRSGVQVPAPVPPPAAAASAAPATGEPPAIESLALAQQTLFAHLGMRGFELARHQQPLELRQQGFVLPGPQLVALYGSVGRKGVYAVGLLDLPACCLIGGLAAGSSPKEMQTAHEQGKPNARQFELASHFMRQMAPLIKKRSPSDAPSLSTTRLSSQPLDKLASLLETHKGRSDFVLRVPAQAPHGDGRLSFLLA
ncbi:response regulator [Paucibacter sp. DJ2R-2]|uniref:response regulator n=1 Tax=Paucibacter sp. DJ2R-2 TaxID=2893558 RepID=UPI0021E35D2C|nr:response regulator [Paucibacter sp. DJ2R-2]MCV2422301.1 response regulator [Paucibacter sp. DJ4R-1]MCV2440115.1 response regulator [Paucibacter sp. DJ2R-2]